MAKKFIRQDSHKKVKLGEKWRRPRGLHSKLRLQKKGHPKLVSVGYGRSKATKFRGKNKLLPVLVSSLKDIEKIDVKNECAIISKNVGLKKKIEMLKEISKKKITVLNLKDIDDFINKSEQKIKDKKQEKEKANKEKQEKKKQLEKEKKDKKSIENDVEKTDEEKKEEQKKEKDKILTKRND